MDNLDYQNECSQIRYPFRDSASLIWANGEDTGILPNAVVLDAQLTIFDSTAGNVRLSAITRAADWTFLFVGIADINIVFADTTGINTYAARSSDNQKLLKIDVDVSALAEHFTAAGTYTFDTSCSLCVSCIKFAPPNITRIRLNNTQHDGSVVDIFDSDDADLDLREGTNVTFGVTNSLVNVDILRGTGLGLYDACPKVGSRITTINEISPDNRGNFLLNNDMCYSTYAGLQGLHMQNVCKPSCTTDEIINMAYYYNRVTDLATQLQAYVLQSSDSLTTWLNNYYAIESERLQQINPYIIAVENYSKNKMNQFHSIAVGIYSPGTASVDATLTLDVDSTEFELVSDSAYIITEGVKTKIPDFSLAGTATLVHRKLICNATTNVGFVLKHSAPQAYQALHTNLGDNQYDASFKLLTPSTGGSGYVLPLYPKTFNFTIAYNVHYEYAHEEGERSATTGQIVNIDLGLIDPAQNTGVVSILVDKGSEGTVATNKIIFDGVTTNLAGLGVAFRSINFKADNHYYLTLRYPPETTGTFPITFAGTSNTGIAKKTIDIIL